MRELRSWLSQQKSQQKEPATKASVGNPENANVAILQSLGNVQ